MVTDYKRKSLAEILQGFSSGATRILEPYCNAQYFSDLRFLGIHTHL